MKWSWRIGSLAGIGLHVHATFFILIAWIAFHHWRMHQNVMAVVSGVGFIMALFACVVLHELGHALAARRFGIGTKDITLLPIGGLARLERMPKDPLQEFLVAIAGPLVNVVIAGAIFAGLLLSGQPILIRPEEGVEVPFLTQLMFVNVALVIFNLLPAFPMDGGRVLRALLATRMTHRDATMYAASVGQSMAIAFAIVGLMANPFLLLIALFVWVGAAQEAEAAKINAALEGLTVESAMLTDFAVLSPDDSLGHAVKLTLAGDQKDFPVVADDQVVGVLSQTNTIAELSQQGTSARVGQVMQKEVKCVQQHELLTNLLERLGAEPARTFPVMNGDRFVGWLTMDNVGEMMMFQNVMRARRKGKLADEASDESFPTSDPPAFTHSHA
ncbi:MAG: site-2 protease family protein [Planctomycetota bacterium]